MRHLRFCLAAAALAAAPMTALAAPLPVKAASAAEQAALLQSPDPVLAANKKLVYDMWRTLLIGGRADQADQYLAPDYMQHNPTLDTGIEPIRALLSKAPKRDIPATIPNLVSIVAERDIVALSFVRAQPDPRDPSKSYTTTWMDMFRIANGKIQEHWDVATLPVAPPAPQPKPAT